jgi:hypothetical protein
MLTDDDFIPLMDLKNESKTYMNPQGYVDPTSKYYIDRVWEEYHNVKEELARSEHIISVLKTLVNQLHKDEASQEVDTFSKEPTLEEQIQYHVDALVDMGAKYYSGEHPYMEGYPRLVLPKESSDEVEPEPTNSGNHISMKDAVYQQWRNRLTVAECIDRLKEYGWKELRGSDGLTEAVNELFLGSRILVYNKQS